MEKFKNKYRIPTTRLPGRDYSQPGKYFITICVKNREHAFGRIENRKMILSDAGNIVHNEWVKTPKIRKNVQLDEFQVMPDHLHGIIIITYRIVSSECKGGAFNAPLQPIQPIQPIQQIPIAAYKNKFGPQKNNVSSIVGGFKSAATKLIWKIGFPDFQWQSRFHDHIIRIENSAELMRIRNYIIKNPENWNEDEFQ